MCDCVKVSFCTIISLLLNNPWTAAINFFKMAFLICGDFCSFTIKYFLCERLHHSLQSQWDKLRCATVFLQVLLSFLVGALRFLLQAEAQDIFELQTKANKPTCMTPFLPIRTVGNTKKDKVNIYKMAIFAIFFQCKQWWMAFPGKLQ